MRTRVPASRSRRTPGVAAAVLGVLVAFLCALPPGPGAPATGPVAPATALPPALPRSDPAPSFPACGGGTGGACAPVPAAPAPLATGPPAWFDVTGGMKVAPPPLVGASILYDPIDNYLVMFGGCLATACPAPAQTWRYAGGAWTELTNQSVQPPARTGASFVFDDRDGYALLFGGWAGPGRPLNDTWKFLGGTWTNLTAGVAPPARNGAGLVYDHVDNEMVLFGGSGLTGPLGDTWRFIAGAWTNLTASVGTAPPPRWDAGFVFDAGDGYALLVDGRGAAGPPLNDDWAFARGVWSALAPPALPPARFGAGLAYDGGPNATYLIGGNSSTGPITDTWRYAGGRWTNVTSALLRVPAGRSGAAVVPTTNTWPGPAPRRWPYVVLFGGTTRGCLPCAAPSPGDTWVLEPILTATPTGLPTVAEVGQPIAFSAAAAGGTGPYIFLWLFGDGSSAFTGAAVHAYPRPGTFTAVLNATDAAGVWDLGSLLVTIVPGPLASGTARPNPVDAGRPVALTSAATGGTPPYTYRWSFGDGATASTQNASHAFGAAGTYSVNVTVTDAVLGYGTWSVAVVVHPALALTASTLTAQPVVRSAVNFSAVPAGGTPPYTVYWAFGDNTTASGLTASHVYAVAATYSVSVSVVDATGAEVTQQLPVVVALPAPGPHGPAGDSWYPWAILLAAVVVGGAIGAVGWSRRRRHRPRPPPAPLAAAAVSEEEWERDGAPGASSASRSMRRTAGRPRR